MKDVITQQDRQGCGRVRVWVCSSPATRTGSSLPTTFLGISSIGCDIVSEGVHKVKPCSGRLLVGVPQVAALVMARGPVPGTSPEIVGWDKGAHTCLHVRPGSLTILENHINRTTHHPSRSIGGEERPRPARVDTQGLKSMPKCQIKHHPKLRLFRSLVAIQHLALSHEDESTTHWKGGSAREVGKKRWK